MQTGHEVADGHEHDFGFTQRGKDAADVSEERRIGADHEHAVAFHPLALGVEQVRDAVQRHHGLPGARTALDHQHPLVIQPDDLVLLGLDRRDDVAHPLTTRRVDRGEQRGIPSLATAGTAEDLVGEIDHLAPARVELAAAPHVLRTCCGGDVERACCGRTPIEQQRFVIVLAIENADPADV